MNRTNKKLFDSDAFFQIMFPIWYLRSMKVLVTLWADSAIRLHNIRIQSGDEDEMDHNTIITDSVRNCTRILSEMHKEQTWLQSSGGNSNSNSSKIKETTLVKGMFFMVNILIRLCDIINNQTFLRESMESIAKLDARQFPLSDVVTSRYYYGRFLIRNDRLKDAGDALKIALKFSRTDKPGTKSFLNRVRILILYIPVQLAFGIFPKPKLLVVE